MSLWTFVISYCRYVHLHSSCVEMVVRENLVLTSSLVGQDVPILILDDTM
jgi:hypothetical protein